MEKHKKVIKLSEEVKALIEKKFGQFQSEHFVAMADLLGFHAYQKAGSGERLKLVAENCLSDIIGTNLQYALEAYEWKTHVPMTKDGLIVSGFWDRREKNLPVGYEKEIGGRLLIHHEEHEGNEEKTKKKGSQKKNPN